MVKKLFGTVGLIECLIDLGFTSDKTCKGHHPKFLPPAGHIIPKVIPPIPPFMMLKYDVRQYDKHSCSRYITELVILGFDRKKVIELLSR